MFTQDMARRMPSIQRQLTRLSVLMLALPFANSAHAISVVNGSFEQGLLGWNAYGDVSVQNSSIGISPTDGGGFAVLTTIDAGEPVVYGTPLSGTYATDIPQNGYTGTLDELYQTLSPQYQNNTPYGFFPLGGSALAQTFYADAGQQISFDYNFLTYEYGGGSQHGDIAFVVINGTEVAPLDDHLAVASNANWNSYSSQLWETEFQKFSYFAPTSGFYTVTVSVSDTADTTVMSALAVDNFKVTDVPEPASAALMAAGLLVIGAVRRKRS